MPSIQQITQWHQEYIEVFKSAVEEGKNTYLSLFDDEEKSILEEFFTDTLDGNIRHFVFYALPALCGGLGVHAHNFPLRVYDEESSDRISVKDVFDFLKTMTPFGFYSSLKGFHFPSYCEDELHDCIKGQDCDRFQQICKDERIDLSGLEQKLSVASLLTKSLGPGSFRSFLEKCQECDEIDDEGTNAEEVVQEKVRQMQAALHSFFASSSSKDISAILEDAQNDPDYPRLVKRYGESNVIALIQLGFQLYHILSLVKECDPDEINCLNQVLENPRYTELLTIIHSNFLDREDVPAGMTYYGSEQANTPIDTDFKLPDDFFFEAIDRHNQNEYFNIKSEVIQKGPEVFSGFINYLSKNGFISSEVRIKRLLAYVLTGRGKPKDYHPDEKIKWAEFGGRELFYVIKSLIVSDQGKKVTKYQRIRDFFVGPEWEKKTKDKDYWGNAPAAFQRDLNAFYPTICIIKNK